MKTFVNARLVLPDGVRQNGFLKEDAGKILSFGDMDNSLIGVGEIIDCGGRYLAPGFIDIHSHGGGGFDYMDGSAEDIVGAARAHLRHGTTSVLPTTMTSSDEDLFLTIDNFKEAKKVRENMPDLLGLHLEGPYFDMVEKGAQPDQYIQNPRPEHYMKVMERADGCIKRWSLAPELPGAEETIKYLTSAGVRVAAGHTNATYDELIRGVDWGVSSIAHAGNAIRMIHQREPGVLGAMLLEDRLFCELICDFIHLHPQFVRLVINNKGTDRIVMVADTSDMAGMETGIYDTKPRVTEMTPEGVVYIYGSDVMNGSSKYVLNGVENLVERLGYPMEEVAKMSSLNAARLLGMERERGSIRVGKYGDFTILTDDYEVLYTISEGVVVYDAQRDDACLNPELLKLKRR